MKTALLTFALAAAVSAWPGHSSKSPHTEFRRYHDTLNANDITEPFDLKLLQTEQHRYIPPGPNDVRSSCPFMSACANHGILPRDGRNVHFEAYYRCAHFGGFGKTLFRTTRRSLIQIAKQLQDADKKANVAEPHAKDRVSLMENSLPGPIEHDLSLTMLDVDFKNLDLNRDSKPSRQLVMDLLQLAANKRGCTFKVTNAWMDDIRDQPVRRECYLDETDIGQWIATRTKQEEERHKQLGRAINWGVKPLVTGAGEAVFLLFLIGRDGEVNMEHAKQFLWHNRFPAGWTPPKTIRFQSFLAKTAHMAETYTKYRKNKSDPHAILAGMKEWDEKKLIDHWTSEDANVPGVCSMSAEDCKVTIQPEQ